MALDYFKLEKGLRITDAGSEVGVLMLQGSGAPAMDADVGSQYLDRADGRLYTKILPGAGADKWSSHAFSSEVSSLIGVWRKERVVIATAVDLVAGPVLYTDITDADTPLPPYDFETGKLVLANIGVSTKAFVVTAHDGLSFTIADAGSIAEDDTFLCEHYLPDPAAQESLAIVTIKEGLAYKLADIDWKDGNGILVGAPPGGVDLADPISASESLARAATRTDLKAEALIDLSGVAAGVTTYGSSNYALPSGRTAQQYFANIDKVLNSLSLIKTEGVTGEIIIDEAGGGWVPGDAVSCKWVVQVENSNGAVKMCEVLGLSGYVDPDILSDFTVYGKISIGPDFQCEISVERVSSVLQLKVNVGANVVNVIARRQIMQQLTLS